MDISCVIVEYRSLERIGSCLDSLLRQTSGLAGEIIVSSNSEYPEEERERLKGEFPAARWLFNDRNGGFAYAANRGIEAATGDVIVLLNPDARPRGGLHAAFRFLRDNADAAVLGPKIVNGAGELQDSARAFMTPAMAMRRSLARVFGGSRVLLDRAFDPGRSQPVDWVIGAFMMVNKTALAAVGLLDEGYFMYVEDMDWCRRFRDAGYNVYYFPGLVVEFQGTRRSTAWLCGGKMPGRFACIHARSYLRFLLKHGRPFKGRDKGMGA